MTHGGRFAVALALCLLAACRGDEPGGSSATPLAGRIFAEPPTLPPAAPTSDITPAVRASLPRTAADISLGMTQAEVERVLGNLNCDRKPAGYVVCTVSKDTGAQVSNLEVFFYHEIVLSLSYATPPPGDAWSHLDSLVKTYGEPSLNGIAEHDSQGQLHEIYGWKDDVTLYSVRFIWVEESPKPRRLSGMAVMLWDREAYFEWEKDPSRLQTHLPDPTPTISVPTAPPPPERA